MSQPLDRLREQMSSKNVDAAFVSDLLNVGWLTGFTGSSGFAIVTSEHSLFLTDSRYTIQANEEVSGFDVRWYQRPKTFEEFAGECLADLGIKSIAFEPSISYATWKSWGDKIGGVEWIDAPDLFKPLRMIKTPEEIALTRDVCGIADACCEYLRDRMQAGRSEFDVQLDLEFFLRRQGAEIAFDPIVVSGPNSAKPHGQAGDRALQEGDFVTLDLGARKAGYNSDITRTFVVGEPSDRHREVYDQVLKAQLAAIEALQPGTAAKDVDQLSRSILAEKDLDKYFGHGLGHGLGRAVHDYGGLGPTSTDTIEAGQVWTVEPGVYIEGFGGVRIEDDVHVTESGPELLTHYTKELLVIG